MAIGLDKDCSQGRLYWSDISNKQIASVKYDGTDRQVFISEGKLIFLQFFSMKFLLS